MHKKLGSLVGSGLILFFSFGGCSNSSLQTPHVDQPPMATPPASPTSKPAGLATQNSMQGTCTVVGVSQTSQNILRPCKKVALQLIYQQEKRFIISVVRTDDNGNFVLKFPLDAPWKLTSATPPWKAEMTILKTPDGSSRVAVILKDDTVQLKPKPKAPKQK